MDLSVIIPTRSRAQYLRESLRTVAVAIEHCPLDVEVVVSDNASEDDTADVCQTAGLRKLVYIRQPSRVSMRQNFETALSASTGNYVVFIGDDDAVAPHGLLRLSEMISSGNYEILKWRVVSYTWPDLERNRPGSAVLRTAKLSGEVRHTAPDGILQELIRGHARNYKRGGMIYHGCVSRTLVDRVRTAQGGTYFWTTCPDVYSSVANLLHAKTKILAADIPVTIGGASPRSNGDSTKDFSKTAQMTQDMEFTRFVTEYKGDQFLGRLPANCSSIDLITVDALQLSHKLAGLPLSLDSNVWAKRIKVEISGFDPTVADTVLAQMNDLLGTTERRNFHTKGTEATGESTEATEELQSTTTVGFRNVTLVGGPEMAGIETASRSIDFLCSAEAPFSRQPPSFLVRARRRIVMFWRAWRFAKLQSENKS